jgi:hypothetical protein
MTSSQFLGSDRAQPNPTTQPTPTQQYPSPTYWRKACTCRVDDAVRPAGIPELHKLARHPLHHWWLVAHAVQQRLHLAAGKMEGQIRWGWAGGGGSSMVEARESASVPRQRAGHWFRGGGRLGCQAGGEAGRGEAGKHKRQGSSSQVERGARGALTFSSRTHGTGRCDALAVRSRRNTWRTRPVLCGAAGAQGDEVGDQMACMRGGGALSSEAVAATLRGRTGRCLPGHRARGAGRPCLRRRTGSRPPVPPSPASRLWMGRGRSRITGRPSLQSTVQTGGP